MVPSPDRSRTRFAGTPDNLLRTDRFQAVEPDRINVAFDGLPVVQHGGGAGTPRDRLEAV